MIISVIGWYGTETMGDRAILDGLLSVIDSIDKHTVVYLGSLFPFYTQRTLFEEKLVFSDTAHDVNIRLFNIKSQHDRDEAIGKSDALIIGGGPLMDLSELRLLEACFIRARKKKIPLITAGCGIGPLYQKECIDVTRNILSMSDGISFRDSISCETAQTLFGSIAKWECLGDPAVISVENYSNRFSNSRNGGSYMAVNLREYSKEEYSGTCSFGLQEFRHIISMVKERFEEIRLIPMHTFSIGGDDRYYFSRIVNQQNYKNVKIIHKPMNLYELYDSYANAKACIGMRYHSIVMQTILNGNNLVLNYTDSKKGKTMGFLEETDKEGFYNDRLVQLHETFDVKKMEVLISRLAEDDYFIWMGTNMKDAYIRFFESVLR